MGKIFSTCDATLCYVDNSEEVQIVSQTVFILFYFLYMFRLFWKAVIRQLKKKTI
jgi:hypothetical protein